MRLVWETVCAGTIVETRRWFSWFGGWKKLDREWSADFAVSQMVHKLLGDWTDDAPPFSDEDGVTFPPYL